MAEKLTPEQMRDKYKTRRFMCLVAFWYMLATPVAGAIAYNLEWIDKDFINSMSGIEIGLFGSLGLIITAYIGSSTYHDVKNEEGP
jgi:hypothetical protein